MPSNYEPKNHIVPVEVAPRNEAVLDQREITIQSYQTTIPFGYQTLSQGIDSAWLTPQIRFGVFDQTPLRDHDSLNVVLGLQDELTVRAYDYDDRRPLWFSWLDVVVDTVNIRYFRDDDGLLRFKTTGGGRRITDERLYDFNAAFLNIPQNAVTKRHFDLEKLRTLCFERFLDHLYMLRFSDPSGTEYQSIDHALFQSRHYIDPRAGRLQEIQADGQVIIESFDADIEVRPPELATAIQVRFFLRGLSGSLRLRFPKIDYRTEPKTVEEQVRLFYRIVDATEGAILDADYYTHQTRSLDELTINLGMFPDMVDLAPYREVLVNEQARTQFFAELDVAARWEKWQPHLRALGELIDAEPVRQHVARLTESLIAGRPEQSIELLRACRSDPLLSRIHAAIFSALARELQSIPAPVRARAEEGLLASAIQCEEQTWDVDPEAAEVKFLGLRRRLDDFSLDVIPQLLWKLVGVLHDRLRTCEHDAGLLLSQFAWCVEQARNLSPQRRTTPAALRLIAANRVPESVRDGGDLLRSEINDLPSLDDAILNEFGLPLWPRLAVSQGDDGARISNLGIGAAIGVSIRPAGEPADAGGESKRTDLLSRDSVPLGMVKNVTAVDVEFTKFGRRYKVQLEIAGELSAEGPAGNCDARSAEAPITRKRREIQRKVRAVIDPEGIVIGSSPAMFEVFENIHYANELKGSQAVLILGEPGVGKTHIAELLHRSSSRSSKPFKAVNAGGGGGDLNIQRGEWIGSGKGHGIQGLDKNGRPGHLMVTNFGTLFIDEFATLSLDLQAIFLSVLENRAIEKLGGESFTPDVRCVFATNADIDEAVANGTLRRDLVDRIGMTFRIPPLRERRGDILMLARQFAGEHGFTARCLVALLRYSWPGNIRELKMQLDRAIVRKKTEEASTMELAHLDLPRAILADAEGLEEAVCHRELWCLADSIAREEGFSPGSGLQKRAGEIMGVGATQASRMYRTYVLAIADSE